MDVATTRRDSLGDAGDEADRQAYSMLEAAAGESTSSPHGLSVDDGGSIVNADPQQGSWDYCESSLDKPILLACTDDGIVGWCSSVPDHAVVSPGGEDSGRRVCPSTTIVSPAHRGQGIADRLQE